MRKLICFFVLTLVHIQSIAQNVQQLDSLRYVWENEKENDSIRVKAYQRYIWDAYLFNKPDSALILAEQMSRFSQSSEFKKGIAIAARLKGIGNSILGNFEEAHISFQEGLNVSNTIDDKIGIATALNNIGNNYSAQGKYFEALKFFKESLVVSEKINHKPSVGNAVGNIGMIYDLQGDYLKALDYYKRGLKIQKDLNNLHGIGNNLFNIGALYGDNNEIDKAYEYFLESLEYRKKQGQKNAIAHSYIALGRNLHIRNKFDKAMTYIEKSLALGKEVNDVRVITESYLQMGVINNKLKEYVRAESYFFKALKMSENINDIDGTIDALILLSDIYDTRNRYSDMIASCQRSYKLAMDIGMLDFQQKSCACLYKAYKSIGNGIKALEFHEKMLTLSDSLKSEETTKKIQQIEFQKRVTADSLIQVEKDLKVTMAHKEEIRKKERNKDIALAGGIFFLLLSGGLYGRWRYVKKSKAIIEKEKDRSENLLLNILPSEIAEELKEKGRADARDFDLVSILFTDFKGFTQASEKLTAKELIAEINTCFKAFDHICESHGIEKIKTIGDAYMAAGGLPVPSDVAVKSTVLAALEMQQFIIDRLAERQANNEIAFQMRVGIHTGPVVAGIVGVKKFQYDIWGDTVNTASRMESSGAVGKVNISETTYNLLKDDPEFVFESRGKVEAKGKGKVEMFFVSKL